MKTRPTADRVKEAVFSSVHINQIKLSPLSAQRAKRSKGISPQNAAARFLFTGRYIVCYHLQGEEAAE